MKILTLNTWQERGPWQERWEVILAGIKKEQPDICCFQEVFNPQWAEEVRKRTGMQGLVFPPVPSGLMILTAHPVRESSFLTMKTKSPTEDYLRYAVWADIEINGQSLGVFNTHLSWRLPESEIRVRQVEELLAFIEARAGERETVVTGDFNAVPESLEIRLMLEKGFQDAYALLYPHQPGLTWNNQNPFTASSSVFLPDRRIDYIFYRHPAKLLSRLLDVRLVFNQAGQRGIWASDHAGVLAVFET